MTFFLLLLLFKKHSISEFESTSEVRVDLIHAFAQQMIFWGNTKMVFKENPIVQAQTLHLEAFFSLGSVA